MSFRFNLQPRRTAVSDVFVGMRLQIRILTPAVELGPADVDGSCAVLRDVHYRSQVSTESMETFRSLASQCFAPRIAGDDGKLGRTLNGSEELTCACENL